MVTAGKSRFRFGSLLMVVAVGHMMSFETVFRKRKRLVATQHNKIRSHKSRRILDEPVSTNDRPPTELFSTYFWKFDFLTTFVSGSISIAALSSARSFFESVIFDLPFSSQWMGEGLDSANAYLFG